MTDCATCEHRKLSKSLDAWCCTAPEAKDQRYFRTTWVRAVGGACGPAARLYKAKETV